MLHITITKETETGIETICDCDTENAIFVVEDEKRNETCVTASLKGGKSIDTLAQFIDLHERLKKEPPYKRARALSLLMRAEEMMQEVEGNEDAGQD